MLKLLARSLAAFPLAVASPALGQAWEPIPLVTAEAREAGVRIGGEGAQAARSLAIDAQEGDFLLYGIDVGGIFRSVNGGESWEPANVGFPARGASAVAIDPRNARRALAVGMNTTTYARHGLYLTEDQAASWRSVMAVRTAASWDPRLQIAYDAQSFDPQAGFTRDVYWSRPTHDEPGGREGYVDPAICKSTDGGATWAMLRDTAPLRRRGDRHRPAPGRRRVRRQPPRACTAATTAARPGSSCSIGRSGAWPPRRRPATRCSPPAAATCSEATTAA